MIKRILLFTLLCGFAEFVDAQENRTPTSSAGTDRWRLETDAGGTSLQVHGEVLETSAEFIKINLGADDGIKIGHEFEVYREKLYLGRVVIRVTTDDRAVALIMKEFRKGAIKKGDHIAGKMTANKTADDLFQSAKKKYAELAKNKYAAGPAKKKYVELEKQKYAELAKNKYAAGPAKKKYAELEKQKYAELAKNKYAAGLAKKKYAELAKQKYVELTKKKYADLESKKKQQHAKQTGKKQTKSPAKTEKPNSKSGVKTTRTSENKKADSRPEKRLDEAQRKERGAKKKDRAPDVSDGETAELQKIIAVFKQQLAAAKEEAVGLRAKVAELRKQIELSSSKVEQQRQRAQTESLRAKKLE